MKGFKYGKSIIDQIEKTKKELEKSELELTQLKRQEQKLQARNRNAEHKARTRRLIKKGVILEKSSPSIYLLSNEQLQAYLQQVLQSENALKLLEKMIDTNFR